MARGTGDVLLSHLNGVDLSGVRVEPETRNPKPEPEPEPSPSPSPSPTPKAYLAHAKA